jgi:hypothetical protein
MINKSKTLVERRGVLWSLIYVTALAVLTTLPIIASCRVYADEGRIHITFFKTGYGSGSGYLFYQGHKYGLSFSSPKVRKVWITTIDLIGTASNLRNAAEIIGTYTAADDQAATVKHAKVTRLQNDKGIVLEIRAVNLSRLFSLNLSGLTIKNLGWEPSSE